MSYQTIRRDGRNITIDTRTGQEVGVGEGVLKPIKNLLESTGITTLIPNLPTMVQQTVRDIRNLPIDIGGDLIYSDKVDAQGRPLTINQAQYGPPAPYVPLELPAKRQIKAIESSTRKPRVIGDTSNELLRARMEEARERYPKAAEEDPIPVVDDGSGTGTNLTGTVLAPDNSGRLGTQTSLRQPTPAEMLAFLGGVESMKYARPYAGLVQEESLNLPGEEDVSRGDLEFYGYSPEEIDARMSGKGLEWSTDQEVDAPWKIVEMGTGAATKEDIKESMKVRQSEKKPEKRDWMVPYKDKKAMARAAILDTPDIMTGLKRRELMRGYITAGGKKYAITPEFMKSNDPKDLGRVLTSDEVAAAKAQEFLGDKLETVQQSPAISQNPMIGRQSEASPVDPKATKDDPKTVQTYLENNQTPIELDADTISDMRFGGKTQDEIEILKKGGFLPEVVIGEEEEMRLF